MALVGSRAVPVQGFPRVPGGPTSVQAGVPKIVLRPSVTRLGGPAIAMRRLGQVGRGAPAVLQAPPHHVQGVGVAGLRRLKKPAQSLGLVLGDALALEQHPPKTELAFGKPIGGGGADPDRHLFRRASESLIPDIGVHGRERADQPGRRVQLGHGRRAGAQNFAARVRVRVRPAPGRTWFSVGEVS